MSAKEKAKLPVLFYFSAAAGIAVILFDIIYWDLVDLLTVFIVPFIGLFVCVVFLIVFVWSIVLCFKNLRKNFKTAVLAPAVNLAVLLIALFVPFTDIRIETDFKLNLDKREEVVSMIESGELKPSDPGRSDLILLPDEFRYLSKGGGEVIVERRGERLEVFFFTLRGILDNFSGFIYVSDDKLLPGDFEADFFETQKMADNWYWVSSS